MSLESWYWVLGLHFRNGCISVELDRTFCGAHQAQWILLHELNVSKCFK